jgi:hypothetical protein
MTDRWPRFRLVTLALAVLLAAGLSYPGSPLGAIFPLESLDSAFRVLALV